MEFESVRSERDANEESPFLQRSHSDPGVPLTETTKDSSSGSLLTKEEKEKNGKNFTF